MTVLDLMPLKLFFCPDLWSSLAVFHPLLSSSGCTSKINVPNIFNSSQFSSISSGTNNARLAAMLRQLAQYHAKDPNNLFMVRLAQVGGHTNDTLCEIRVNFWQKAC